MKEIKNRISRSWDKWSANYDRSLRSEEEEAWKRFFSEKFGGQKLRILDAGTGTGFLSVSLAELGHDVVGVDMSEGMLAVCRKKAKERRLNLDLRIGDAESLDFEDTSFDAVVSRWVLWTLPHPEKAIREWRRVIKPGEKIYTFETPFAGKNSDGVDRWMRRNLARLMISVIERRNAWAERYGKDIEEKLPLNYNKPGSVINKQVKLFEKCGLENVTVTKMKEASEICKENWEKMPLRYRLGWSGAGDWYSISGYRR